MTTMKKRIIAGITAGAILAAGGLGTLSVQAAANDGSEGQQRPQMLEKQGRRQHPQMKMDADKTAEHISKIFGVSKSEVKAAIDKQTDFRDIGQAAMLSKISGKSFQEVLAQKTDSKDWREIGESMGVSREQVHATMLEMRAQRISQRGNIDAATALKLMQAGYQDRDIQMAAVLAKESGKNIQSVLDMKKINNRWFDVAKDLGVDMTKLRPEHHGQRGPQGTPPEDMMMGQPGPEGGTMSPELAENGQEQ